MRQQTLFDNTPYDKLLGVLKMLNVDVTEHRRIVSIANDRSQSLFEVDAHVIRVTDRGTGNDGDYIEFYFDAQDDAFVDYALLNPPCNMIGPEHGT